MVSLATFGSATLLANVTVPIALLMTAGGALAGAGVVFAYLLSLRGARKAELDRIAAESGKEAEAIRREAEVGLKEMRVKVREEFEAKAEKQRDDQQAVEARLEKREESLERKFQHLQKKEDGLDRSERRVQKTQSDADRRLDDADKKLDEYRQSLERIGGMSVDEARKALVQRVETEMDQELNEVVQRRIQRAKENADEEARKIVIQSIQRYAADYTRESTVATVTLPSDDLKGRIIGRDGRNIRAFERATGVDVIVDDTPGVVTISAFDCIRRETARLALEKLVSDGRIHPARIEEVVEKTQQEMSRIITQDGKQASTEMGIRIHPTLIDLMGRLRYRTSYGQNVLDHSKEVAHLCGLLAADLHLDIKLAKRCGFLHDAGKAIDQEQEGTHPKIGADAAQRVGEREEVINAIASHHNDVPMTSLYAVVVQCADAISAARPGARRESMERYIQRLERLEEIANTYPVIQNAYAIQAGRELRVIAKAEQTTESDCAKICHQIAKQIEEEMSYPGEIKITLIRESRFTDYAR